MSRPHKIDEELWEDGEEALSSDHVVERFFSQHERDTETDGLRRSRPDGRPRRKAPASSKNEE